MKLPVPALQLSIILSAAITTGCTFVSPAPHAETVEFVPAERVGACEELGTTRVEVLAKLGWFPRNKDTVADELKTLARNAAVEIEGNAIADASPVENGKQSFLVLRCP